MATEQKNQKESYYKSVLRFYFAPLFRSFFTAFYLLFFLYFAVYYMDNVSVALRFLFYTLRSATFNFELNSLLWGAAFFVCLLLPFALSIYDIIIPFEMRRLLWERKKKLLVATLIFVAIIDLTLISDRIIRGIERQMPIKVFLEKAELNK